MFRYIHTKRKGKRSDVFKETTNYYDVPSQSCTPNPVESLIEVYEDMVEVLLVLDIFLTEDS